MWCHVVAVSILLTASAFHRESYHTSLNRSRITFPLYARNVPITGITVKLAVDSQGGVAEQAKTCASERFTSPTSLDMVHRLRRDSDGVLVGKGTVLADNPSLTVRRVVTNSQPVRIVLDTHLSLPTHNYAIFNDGLATLVYHADGLKETAVERYATDQTICIGVPLEDGCLSVRAIVEDLHLHRHLRHVMVEGGPTIVRSFLDHDLVDRIILVQARQVTFQEPLPSGITESLLSDHNFVCLGNVNSGDGDIYQCWSRSNLPWPTENVASWP